MKATTRKLIRGIRLCRPIWWGDTPAEKARMVKLARRRYGRAKLRRLLIDQLD